MENIIYKHKKAVFRCSCSGRDSSTKTVRDKSVLFNANISNREFINMVYIYSSLNNITYEQGTEETRPKVSRCDIGTTAILKTDIVCLMHSWYGNLTYRQLQIKLNDWPAA